MSHAYGREVAAAVPPGSVRAAARRDCRWSVASVCTDVAVDATAGRGGGEPVSVTEQDSRGMPEPPIDDWGDGPASYAPGERPTPAG